MGTIGSILTKLSPEETWKHQQRGPTLQRFFGGYGNQELWAALRRFKSIDDGDGFLDYAESVRVLQLPDFSQIFLWDVFAEQGALVDAKVCFTTICIFSGSRLEEKGRFLMALFDTSCEGSITGTELAAICAMVCSIFSKCTGIHAIKAKAVTAALKAELPTLLASTYAEVLKTTSFEKAFRNERCISQKELETLILTLRPYYDALPISEHMTNAYVPPAARQQKNYEMEPEPETTKAAGSGMAAAKERKSVAKRESKKDEKLAHLQWMKSDFLPPEEEKKPKPTCGDPIKTQLRIYGKEFAEIAKDMSSFKRVFSKSVSSSLGVPAACIEVISVSAGSIIVDFLVKPHQDRNASSLLDVLQRQLQNKNSALCKSAFGPFAQSAELIVPEDIEPETMPLESAQMISPVMKSMPKSMPLPMMHEVEERMPMYEQGVQTEEWFDEEEDAEVWQDIGTQTEEKKGDSDKLLTWSLTGSVLTRAAVRAEVAHLKSELDAVNSEKKEEKARMAKATARAERLEKEMELLRNSREKEDERKLKMLQELTTIKHQKDTAEKKVENLNAELEFARRPGDGSASKEEVEFWRNRAETAEKKTDELGAEVGQVDVLRTKAEMAEKQKEELSGRFNEANGRAREAEESRESMSKELEEWRGRTREAEAGLKSIKEELEDSRLRCQAAEDRCESVSKALAERGERANEQLEEQRSRAEEAELGLKSTKEELAEWRERAEVAELGLKSTKEELAEWRERAEVAEAGAQEMQMQAATMRAAPPPQKQEPIKTAHALVRDAIPVPAFSFKPSVGTWLFPSIPGMPIAIEDATSAQGSFNHKPSVGTWLQPIPLEQSEGEKSLPAATVEAKTKAAATVEAARAAPPPPQDTLTPEQKKLDDLKMKMGSSLRDGALDGSLSKALGDSIATPRQSTPIEAMQVMQVQAKSSSAPRAPAPPEPEELDFAELQKKMEEALSHVPTDSADQELVVVLKQQAELAAKQKAELKEQADQIAHLNKELADLKAMLRSQGGGAPAAAPADSAPQGLAFSALQQKVGGLPAAKDEAAEAEAKKKKEEDVRNKSFEDGMNSRELQAKMAEDKKPVAAPADSAPQGLAFSALQQKVGGLPAAKDEAAEAEAKKKKEEDVRNKARSSFEGGMNSGELAAKMAEDKKPAAAPADSAPQGLAFSALQQKVGALPAAAPTDSAPAAAPADSAPAAAPADSAPQGLAFSALQQKVGALPAAAPTDSAPAAAPADSAPAAAPADSAPQGLAFSALQKKVEGSSAAASTDSDAAEQYAESLSLSLLQKPETPIAAPTDSVDVAPPQGLAFAALQKKVEGP